MIWLILASCIFAFTNAEDEIRGKLNYINDTNYTIPETNGLLTWQDIADSFLCSSGDAEVIRDAVNDFDSNSQWFVFVG